MTILLRPIMTEKSMKMASGKEYTFEVASKANVKQIAKEVADKFKVDVLSVKIINVKSEQKTNKTREGYIRGYWKHSAIKKAIVRIKKDQVITLFETAAKESEAVVERADEEPVIIKEKKDILRRTNVKVERGVTEVAQTTQRKVITGK